MRIPDPTFSSAQLKKWFGVSRRQLSYWSLKGHITPSARPDGVRASVYSLGDVLRIFFVTELIRRGYSSRKALALEKRLYPILLKNAVRVDDSVSVLFDRKDRIMVVRGFWWPEPYVEIAKYSIPFSILYDKLAEEGIIP